MRKFFLMWALFLYASQSLCSVSLAEQFKRVGYVELCDTQRGAVAYDALYAYFDELISFLHTHQSWAHKLYIAKERFIRSKDHSYYATDFVGFFDESKWGQRNQVAFYYSYHFHAFITAQYPEFNHAPQIIRFLDACSEIAQSYADVFQDAAAQLGAASLFVSDYGHPPVLLKVVKYMPAYTASRPHYDGTAFSLLLDSTDNESLLLSAYKSSYMVDDFASALRVYARCDDRNSVLLIPGTFLVEYGVYPTPHIVVQSNKARYATIAFAMRPHYTAAKQELAHLPDFKH